jgi:hypothetical protein
MQHARAQRLRDLKIEDRLFLGLMIGGSTGLASLSLFFRIKSTSKALAVGRMRLTKEKDGGSAIT